LIGDHQGRFLPEVSRVFYTSDKEAFFAEAIFS